MHASSYSVRYIFVKTLTTFRPPVDNKILRIVAGEAFYRSSKKHLVYYSLEHSIAQLSFNNNNNIYIYI